MYSIITNTLLAALLFQHATSTNVYPAANPAYDDIEDLYTLTDGLGSMGMLTEIKPCDTAPFSLVDSGRQTVAEWIRTVFHDVATHNKTAGTGGLDASISLELDRPENSFASLTDTIGVIDVHIGAHRTLSDLLALGVVLAVAQCRGPTVPLRVGRIDATVAGPSGVPDPSEDIATLTREFDRMGFTPTEMIGLVACGHSFGGVHQVDFPTIVPESEVTANNTDGIQKFAKSGTYNSFDNHLAKEWIDGTTTDPLVTSFNASMHSDSRVFSLDHNVTMKAFAKSSTLFNATCGKLFERLIDTVPREVVLSDPIVPYPVKPYQLGLTLVNETSLAFVGYIRLFDKDYGTFGSSTIDASITWKDRNSSTCPSCHIPITYDPTSPSQSLWGSVALASVNTTINIATGISSYVVDYTTRGKPSVHANNGGAGFPMQDRILYYRPLSCVNFGLGQTRVVAAIRNDAGTISAPFVQAWYPSNTGPGLSLTNSLVSDTSLISPSSHYTMYSAVVSSSNIVGFTLSATVGGKMYQQGVDSTFSSFNFGCF